MKRPSPRPVVAVLGAATLFLGVSACSAGPDPERFQHLWAAATVGLDRLPDDPNSVPGSRDEATARLDLPANLTLDSWEHQPGAKDGSFCFLDKAAGTYFAVQFTRTPHATPVTVMLGDAPECSFEPAKASVVSSDYLTFTKGADLMGNISTRALGAAALERITTDAKAVDTAVSDALLRTGAYPASTAEIVARMAVLGLDLHDAEEIRDYRGADGAFSFCLVEPKTGAWGYYDSESSEVTASGPDAATCTEKSLVPTQTASVIVEE